jgi:hypothetical protein
MDKNSAAELTLEEINSTLASLRLDGFDLSFVGASQREFDLRTRLEEVRHFNSHELHRSLPVYCM